MRLIVTEKNNSAKKISQILSGGGAVEDKAYTVPFYTWEDGEGTHRTVGLKGHLLNPAFPEGYENWQKTDPRSLIDATLVKEATNKNVLRTLKKLAKEATSVVIATDYDREGELIGLEALTEILGVNAGVEDTAKRARYSALTKEEIERAFAELDTLSFDLAYAGAARQDIDLIWGATLTRAVSLATRRFGSNFLSVGRVQSPTLGLIVAREMERRAHVSKPYWELLARFAGPGGAFEAHHATDKFWVEAEADAALTATVGPGTVTKVASRKQSRKPPTPFNTTAFSTEASSRLGITPARAMRIAEDLYMDGFISYPRTDNTVYPPSLPIRELISSLVKIPDFAAAAPLLEQSTLTATRGKKETTDHPPIYPTQAIHPSALEGPHLRVYELVARRFLATFCSPMISESTRADIEAGGQPFFVRGSVVVDPGFAAIYVYSRSADNEIPQLTEGEELELEKAWLDAKETQPPSRISQGKLIELMEERGLGTKATRADIIQKLYDRGYVYSNPPVPSETGIAMYEAFQRYVPRMATPEMTAELEADMDKIASGATSKEEVLRVSRELLHSTYGDLNSNEKDLAKVIWAGMDLDRILGPCKVCEDAGRTQEDGSPTMLRVIRAKKSGKRFVGCQGWSADDPNSCDQTFPLPQRGDVFKLEDRCSICGQTPRLKVMPPRGRQWNLCLNDDCPSMEEMKKRRAEREAAMAAKEAGEPAGDGNGDGATPKKAPGKRAAAGKGASGRPRKRPARRAAPKPAGSSREAE